MRTKLRLDELANKTLWNYLMMFSKDFTEARVIDRPEMLKNRPPRKDKSPIPFIDLRGYTSIGNWKKQMLRGFTVLQFSAGHIVSIYYMLQLFRRSCQSNYLFLSYS